RIAAGGGDRIPGEGTRGCDSVHAAVVFGEPEVAVRPRRNEVWSEAATGDGVLGDNARSGHLGHLVAILFCEPEIAVRPRRNAVRNAAERNAAGGCGDRVLSKGARGRHLGDVAILFGEPEISVWPGGDA